MEFPELFSAHGLNHTAMFARLFCAALTIQLLLNFSRQHRYFISQPAKLYGKGPKLLGVIALPALSQSQFLAFGLSLGTSLSLVCFGIYPHVAVSVALISYFLYFGQIISLESVQRKTNLLPIVLLILLMSPSLGKPLSSPSAGWEVLLIKIALTQVYFSAGLQKVRQSGFKWLNGKYLQAYLLENYLWTGQTAARAIALNPILCAVLSSLVLVFELTFPLAIFVPAIIFFYAGFALLFHIGTLVTMRINYLKYLGPVYLVFFTELAFRIQTMPGT